MTAVGYRPAPLALLRVGSAVVFASLLVATLLTTAGKAAASSSQSPSSYSSRLVQLVNSTRSSHGLRPLILASGTTAVAASWTAHMAQTGNLSHNMSLVWDLQHHGSANMRAGDENVGCGAPNDPNGLFQAYMNSPEHRANILDSNMRYLGMAVAFGGIYAWNTMDFVDVYGTHAVTHAATRSASPPRHVAAPPPARHVQRPAHVAS